jgi:hypothetical protein
MEPVRYPPLGITDTLVFFMHVLVQLGREVPPHILLRSLVILLLYLPVILVELLEDMRRPNTPQVNLTVFQCVVVKLLRLAVVSFDYRVAKVVSSPAASLPLMERRFGGKGAFDLYCAPVDTLFKCERIQGYWLAPPGNALHLARGHCPSGLTTTEESRWTLCYFHGGSFVMGSPEFYLDFLHKLRLTLAQTESMRNAVIFVPAYPLAPGACQPTQANVARAAWAYLAAHPAVDTARMAVGGDSSGGTLALGLRMAIGASVSLPEMVSYQCLPSPSQIMSVLLTLRLL